MRCIICHLSVGICLLKKKKKVLGYDLHIEDQNYKFFVNSKL